VRDFSSKPAWAQPGEVKDDSSEDPVPVTITSLTRSGASVRPAGSVPTAAAGRLRRAGRPL
jgi:hypothetical protein